MALPYSYIGQRGAVKDLQGQSTRVEVDGCRNDCLDELGSPYLEEVISRHFWTCFGSALTNAAV